MEADKHLIWAQRLCSAREVCPQEMRLKLKARGVEPEEAERMIAALIEQDFINEERYVSAFVHDKSKLQGWGREKIRYALFAKQIPEATLNKALARLDPSIQKETLRRLLEAKRLSVKAASETDLCAKLIRFGLARGFTYEDVIQSVHAIIT